MEDAGRNLAQRILNKISGDATFRDRLVKDHQAALDEEGFLWDLRNLQQGGDAEVGGYMMPVGECSPHRITCIENVSVLSGPVGG
jgi:hypothetical protein